MNEVNPEPASTEPASSSDQIPQPASPPQIPSRKRPAVPDSFGPLDDVLRKQFYRRRKTLVDEFSKYASGNDLANVLASALSQIEDQFPTLQQDVLTALSRSQGPPASCDTCARVAQGLGEIRAFKPSNPSAMLSDVRWNVDKVMRHAFQDRARLGQLGYPIGEKRWIAAGKGQTVEKHCIPLSGPSCNLVTTINDDLSEVKP